VSRPLVDVEISVDLLHDLRDERDRHLAELLD